jgi:hypothetical protein
MAPEIKAEHDAARETLDALAVFAGLERGEVVRHLARETADMRLHGVETLFPRWIRRPLDAMPAFEDVHRRVAIALHGVGRELKQIESDLARVRAEGRHAEMETLSREAARLLCREADLRERVESRDEEKIAAARDGIARILDVTLRCFAKATARYSHEAKTGGAAEMRRALANVEAYERLVREAQTVTGGAIDAPHFRDEFVQALRRRCGRKGAGAIGTARPLPA